MRGFSFVMMLGVAGVTAGVEAAAGGMPLWAYGYTAPPAPRGASAPSAAPPAPEAAPSEVARTLPGSSRSFTRSQIYNVYGPADWFPSAHPPMPAIVAKGDTDRNIWACSLCHLANGKGRPENASVSGLPVAYFVQTMAEFKNGNRKSSDPRKRNANQMIGYAKAMTDAEVKAAAAYFGAIAWTPWVKVKETNTVPKTHVDNGLFIPNGGTDTEPLGNRIVEVPENVDLSENLRSPRSGFIAYVPQGSIKRGKALVATGGGKTIQCGACHGADLRGSGSVPRLAGRSPSYLARQIYDFQTGSRKGSAAAPMKPVVANLKQDDLIAITAYVASLR